MLVLAGAGAGDHDYDHGGVNHDDKPQPHLQGI